MSKQVTNDEVLAAGKKKRQAKRNLTAAETNKFNATKVAEHEQAAQEYNDQAEAINNEVEAGIKLEEPAITQTPTTQAISYNGQTYSSEEVDRMFNAIETWGQHNLRPGDLKRFQKGMEGLRASNASGHIFISGNDPDKNIFDNYGKDAQQIPERLLLKLLENSKGTSTTQTTSTSNSAASGTPTATAPSGQTVGSIDPLRKYLKDTYFGGEYSQYKADLTAEERYTTREERLEHLREAARAIMTERNLDTGELDQLDEKQIFKQLQNLGVNVNEARQYLGIQKQIVDPYNLKIDASKLPDGYSVVQDLFNDGFGIINGPNGPVLIDSNYQQVRKGPDEIIHNKNGYVIFTDSQGNLKYGPLSSFNQNDFKALQNINALGTTPFDEWNPYTIGDEDNWNDYLEQIFEGQSGNVQYLDVTGKFPELQGYEDYKIIVTDNVSTDANGGQHFQNSNGFLYKPNGEKIAIKVNTGSDSKITITGPDNKVLYNGFEENRANYDTGWLDKGSYNLGFMNNTYLGADIRGNEDYNIDLEEIDLNTGKLKDKWYNNDAVGLIGNALLLGTGILSGGAAAAAWGAKAAHAAHKATKLTKGLVKTGKVLRNSKKAGKWLAGAGYGTDIFRAIINGYGQHMDPELAEEMSGLIDGMSSDLLTKSQYADTDAKAYAYTVYRILTKENTQSLQKGVREMLMSKGWSQEDVKRLHNQFINFGILQQKTTSQKQGGILKAQTGMSFDNVVTKDNEDMYKAQWEQQKAQERYDNMIGDPHQKTKGGHGIGSNEWDIYDTADSIVIGLDTLAAGASFIPGVGSIVSAISGVAATGVQLINDIAKGEGGSTVLKNLAWNGAFAVLGAIPGVKALKAGKAIKNGVKAIDKSLDVMRTAAKADKMDDALKAYETAADSIKNTLKKDKKAIGWGLNKLANNEWVMGTAKWAGRAMQIAGAGTGALGAYNVITDAASGEEVQLQDVRMMLGGLTGTAAGAMHSLGKRAAKNVGTTIGDAMDELGIVSKQAGAGKQKVKLGKHEIEIDVPANMTKDEAREAAKSQLISKRDEAKRVAALKVGTKDGDIDVTEALIKQKQSEADELDKLLAKDEKFFSRKLKLSGFDEKAAKQSDDWKEQLIATKPKGDTDSAWENFGRWYGKKYLGLDNKSVKQMFNSDVIDDVKVYKQTGAPTTDTPKIPTNKQLPAANIQDNVVNSSNIKQQVNSSNIKQQPASKLKLLNEYVNPNQNLIKTNTTSSALSNPKNNPNVKIQGSTVEETLKAYPGLKWNGKNYGLQRTADGKYYSEESKRLLKTLLKNHKNWKQVELPDGKRYFEGIGTNNKGLIIEYQQGGSLNQIQLQKLGGLAQKANNRLGEPLNTQVDKYQDGTGNNGVRPAGTSRNIQYTSENPNWFSLMGNDFVNALIKQLQTETDPLKRRALVDKINKFQKDHYTIRNSQTDNGKLRDWISKDDATAQYQTDINNEFGFVNTDGIAYATANDAFTTTKNSYGVDAATKWGADGLFGAQTDSRRVLGRDGDFDQSAIDLYNKSLNDLGYEMYLDPTTKYYMLKEKGSTPIVNPDSTPDSTPEVKPITQVTKQEEKPELPPQFRGVDFTALEAVPSLIRATNINKANLDLMNSTNPALKGYKNDHYKLSTDLATDAYLKQLAAQANQQAQQAANNTADLRQAQAVQMQGAQQAADYQLKGAMANKQAYDESAKIAMATENEDANYNRQIADTNAQILYADELAKKQQLAGYNNTQKHNWDTYETQVRMGKDLVKKAMADQAEKYAQLDYKNALLNSYGNYNTGISNASSELEKLMQANKDAYDAAIADGTKFENPLTFDLDSKVTQRYGYTKGNNALTTLNYEGPYAQLINDAIAKGLTWRELQTQINEKLAAQRDSEAQNHLRHYYQTVDGSQYVHGQFYSVPRIWGRNRTTLSDESKSLTSYKQGGTLSAADRKEIVRIREGYKNLQKQVDNMYKSLKRDSDKVDKILDGLSKERSFLLKQIFR